MNYGLYVPPIEHYALLRRVLSCASGVAVEFGTGRGESTAIIADKMSVTSFGSVHGIPEDWRDDPDGTFVKGDFAFPLPDVPNATIVEGLFTETLPDFDFGKLGEIGLVHFDADLYSSTLAALECIGNYLDSGCVLVFDEFIGYESAEYHEQAALRDWLTGRDVKLRPLGHSHQAVAFQII